MPPRFSSNRGDPRGGRPPRGGHHGGDSRGSQPGGPSSVNADATPTQITPPSNTNPLSPSRGQPTGNRGHGRGRGRGVDRGGAPRSPPSAVATPAPITNTETTAGQNPVRGHSFHGRGRGDHRGSARDSANRGGAPGSPSSAVETPVNPTTASPSQTSVRGSFRGGRGGNRGSARGSFQAPPTDQFRGRGRGRGRGGFAGGGPPDLHPDTLTSIPDIGENIITFGAKRPGFGKGGVKVNIVINAFPTTGTVPDLTMIYQYDVVVHNGKLPARLNMELLSELQLQEPNVFTPKVVYDGRKIIFSVRELPLGPDQRQKFSISRPRNGRPPKVYDITLTMAAPINTEILQRFTARDLSHNENVSTALAALNVAVKMQPNQTHPFNKRSFYIPDGKSDIGGGIELWRGIFQSVRPTIGRLIVNIDLSTGLMYKEGSLINLCIDFFGGTPNTSPNELLSPGTRSFREIERNRLQKFLSGVRVLVKTTGDRQRVVRGLSRLGADKLTFETRPGVQITVAEYFRSLSIPLIYPSVVCVLVGQTAMVPLELCTVPRGQFMRKEIPDDKVRDILAFSTMKPHERLARIRAGLQYLQYGQSEYVRNFGMTIENDPITTKARIIEPPKLRYNATCDQPSIELKRGHGAWNMIDKKFYEPSKIGSWVIVIYDSQRNFPEPAYRDSVKGFLAACDAVGIHVENREPVFKFEDGQGPIDRHLLNAVKECERRFKQKPSLIVVVLPNIGGDIYNAVKHFGDITFGIPTQCLKSFSCRKAKSQYWNNVMLKVNVKLGGINVIPDSSSLAAEALIDPANPTIVMGADVMHPPPGVNRPSYTAIIGSVDSHAAKYVATSRAQTGRQEIINDMKDMCKTILGEYKEYQVNREEKEFKLSRLIFYRDGVSESQFKQVLELELPMIQEACEEFGVNPKITLIVVGKRHHIQFFPLLDGSSDRSGNCLAGTVVDTDVTHPTDHDFYLLSHAGILGTSRPAHYSVLYDDSGFNADTLQSLSYSLCYLYAPSTRSVSVPAPVYYADMVCSRAKTHFDPQEHLTFDASTDVSGSTNLEAFKEGYMPLHANQQKAMYFA